MIKAGAIEKGMFLLVKDVPHLVAEREFVNPGKGSAFVRLKLKNMKTGSVLKEVRKTQDAVEEVSVEEKDNQYLYNDGSNYAFMDAETFEQTEVPMEGLEDYINFMKEGDTYKLIVWGDTVLDIKLPYKMVFEVTEAEDGVKGDSVNNIFKTVTIETGLVVKVPIFIKQGERVMINTETKEYVERVNK